MKSNYYFFKVVLSSTILFSIFTNSKANQTIDSIKLLVQESKYDEVLKVITRLKQNQKATSNVYYFEGVSYKNLYKFQDAIESFQKAYQMDTSNSQNLIEIANCYKIINEYKKALDYYEIANTKTPDNKLIQTEIANMYFSIENYEIANKLFHTLYASDTSNIYYVKNIAKCYNDIGQDDSTMFYLKKILQLGSSDYQIIYKLCNIYIKKKKYDEALKLTDKYLQSDSLNPKINSVNAYLYLLKKDYANSYNRFLKCYSTNDTSKFVLKYLGISAFKLDSFESAKLFLEKAYYIDSSDYQLTNFLGIACASYVYKQLGIYYLNKTVKLLTPDSLYFSAVYFNLGKAYDSYSNSPCKNGFDAYQRALALNPKDTLAILFLAYKYQSCLKDKEMAIKYFKQFIATRPPKKKDDKNKPFIFSYYDSAIRELEELEKK